MKDVRSWLFVLAIIIVPLTAFGIVKWYQGRYTKLPLLGPQNHTVNTFEFNDQNGNIITKNNWQNKIVVANYFFARCPSVCPRMINNLKKVQAISDDNVLITSFTVDPKNDSITTLRNYAKQFKIAGNWHLLKGEKIDLYRFARKELFIVATDGDGGANDFIHSENFVLIDKQQRIRGYYKGTDETEVQRLINDIDKLKQEQD